LVLAVGRRSIMQVRTRYHTKRNFSAEHRNSSTQERHRREKNTLKRLKLEKQQHMIVFREEHFRMGWVEPVT